MADRSDIIPNTWHFIPARQNQGVRWRWQRRDSRHEVSPVPSVLRRFRCVRRRRQTQRLHGTPYTPMSHCGVAQSLRITSCGDPDQSALTLVAVFSR